MKVAFDAQLLFEKEKTGIGWNAKCLIDRIIEFPDIECTLNYFCMRDRKRADAVLKEYREKGCHIRQSWFLPARIYNHLERFLPFPYRLFLVIQLKSPNFLIIQSHLVLQENV